MNQIAKFSLYSFFALLVVLTSCASDHKEVPMTIEMQKLTGEWITRTYMLPEGCNIYIDTNRGSYTLKYSLNRKWFAPERGTIRAGIVDYRVSR